MKKLFLLFCLLFLQNTIDLKAGDELLNKYPLVVEKLIFFKQDTVITPSQSEGLGGLEQSQGLPIN